jgi:uncharacterized protein
MEFVRAFKTSLTPTREVGELGLYLSRGQSVSRSAISIPEEQVAEFCRRHHIHKLSLFGSVVRRDFGPGSDVDVLVEFEPGHAPGLEFFTMESELGLLLGRKVELHTPQFLSTEIRKRALAEAEVRYVAP